MKKFLILLLTPIVKALVEEEVKDRVEVLVRDSAQDLKNQMEGFVRASDEKLRSEITQNIDRVFYGLNKDLISATENLNILSKTTSHEINSLSVKLKSELSSLVDVRFNQIISNQQDFFENIKKDLGKNSNILDVIKKLK